MLVNMQKVCRRGSNDVKQDPAVDEMVYPLLRVFFLVLSCKGSDNLS
jgi:hypothetical protein